MPKYVKGQSGNPAKKFSKTNQPPRENVGRPMKIPEIDVLLAEVLGENKEGINAAKAILMNLRGLATQKNAIGIRAAEVLLDRAYGKAKQAFDHTTDGEKIAMPAPVITVLSTGVPFAASENEIKE